MNKKKKKAFARELIGLLADYTGCSIQKGGCPCNTCFFGLMDDLGIPAGVSVGFWRSALLLRGDYKIGEMERMIQKERRERASAVRRPLEDIIEKLVHGCELTKREQKTVDKFR